ncbi:MAG TPA: GNAT family N-acetyltransferase [Spirochaetales bacterium]|nr:GNAT family N-acetyltransferase [Spirochaetales bacterium]
MFPLTDEFIERLIFAMEDQKHRFIVDFNTGDILSSDDDLPDYLEIPLWRQIEGFSLMEKFVSKLRNPLHREPLHSVLSSGKGVFRNFKDALKKNGQLERLWLSFKEKEMRRIVRDWYNEQRELKGLQRLGPEPEETEELLLSDFTIKPGSKEYLEAVIELDRQAMLENIENLRPEKIEELYRNKRSLLPAPLDKRSLLLVIETPEGELAGFAWGVETENQLDSSAEMRLVQLAVARNLRGLGLGKLLLHHFVQETGSLGMCRLVAELSGPALKLAAFFKKLGFVNSSVVMALDLDNRKEA